MHELISIIFVFYLNGQLTFIKGEVRGRELAIWQSKNTKKKSKNLTILDGTYIRSDQRFNLQKSRVNQIKLYAKRRRVKSLQTIIWGAVLRTWDFDSKEHMFKLSTPKI